MNNVAYVLCLSVSALLPFMAAAREPKTLSASPVLSCQGDSAGVVLEEDPARCERALDRCLEEADVGYLRCSFDPSAIPNWAPSDIPLLEYCGLIRDIEKSTCFAYHRRCLGYDESCSIDDYIRKHCPARFQSCVTEAEEQYLFCLAERGDAELCLVLFSNRLEVCDSERSRCNWPRESDPEHIIPFWPILKGHSAAQVQK